MALGSQPARAVQTSAFNDVSQRALLWAARSTEAGVQALGDALYEYNSFPLSVADHRANRETRCLLAYDARAISMDDWIERGNTSAKAPFWLHWQHRRHAGDHAPTYKLYVCLALNDVTRVFADVMAVLASNGAFAAKFAANWRTARRPDRFVVYFDSLQALRSAAQALSPIVSGKPVQQLPFAVALAEPALFWGVDFDGDSLGNGRTSWRHWLTGILAALLHDARAGGATPFEAAAHARTAVQDHGIDPVTWAPRSLHV